MTDDVETMHQRRVRQLFIECEAREAARLNQTRDFACRWPIDSPEGRHWTAQFLLAGGRLKDEPCRA